VHASSFANAGSGTADCGTAIWAPKNVAMKEGRVLTSMSMPASTRGRYSKRAWRHACIRPR
jgi:hypothetical protein